MTIPTPPGRRKKERRKSYSDSYRGRKKKKKSLSYAPTIHHFGTQEEGEFFTEGGKQARA